MSMRTMRPLVVEEEVGQRLRELGLAGAGRAEERGTSRSAGWGRRCPARARVRRRLTAVTAARWPIRRSPRTSSMLQQLVAVSPSSIRPAGMPVQAGRRPRRPARRPTSSPTSGASSRRGLLGLGGLADPAPRARGSRRRAGSPAFVEVALALRPARLSMRWPGRARRRRLALALAARTSRAPSGPRRPRSSSSLSARSARRSSSRASHGVVAPRGRGRTPPSSAASTRAAQLVDLRRGGLDLHAQPDAASSTRSMALSGSWRPVM